MLGLIGSNSPRSLAGKPFGRFRATRERRISVLYGLVSDGIRQGRRYSIEIRLSKIGNLDSIGFPARFLGHGHEPDSVDFQPVPAFLELCYRTGAPVHVVDDDTVEGIVAAGSVFHHLLKGLPASIALYSFHHFLRPVVWQSGWVAPRLLLVIPNPSLSLFSLTLLLGDYRQLSSIPRCGWKRRLRSS